MTTKLLASGMAVAAIGAASAGMMTPVAMASTGTAGVQVQPVTWAPYARDRMTIPLGGCLSSCNRDEGDEGNGKDQQKRTDASVWRDQNRPDVGDENEWENNPWQLNTDTVLPGVREDWAETRRYAPDIDDDPADAGGPSAGE